MKRIVKNSPKEIHCQICDKHISSYGMTSHLKYAHNITVNDYEVKYGIYRQQKSASIHTRQVFKHTCKICNEQYSSVGMNVHLRDTHNISIAEYESKYNVFISNKRKKYESEKNDTYKCLICGDTMISNKMLIHHISQHNINVIDYIKKYIFNNIPQYCKCGCNAEVKYKTQPPYKSEYISGHNSAHSNPMKNHTYNSDTLEKMSLSAINRMGITNKINTSIEIEFKSWLELHNIEYEQQYKTVYGSVDFYIPLYDLCIEIDGEYWHPMKIENLTFRLLAVITADYRKDTNISKLIRIRENDIKKLSHYDNISDLYQLNIPRKYNISYNTIIIDKSFFENFIKYKGIEKIRPHIRTILNFIRTVHPAFPYPEHAEALQYVLKKLSENKSNTILSGNKFNNTKCSSVGNKYLKSKFKSYWHSSYGNSKTPVEAWEDDNIMMNVIKYRIGCNNSNEIFDFSLHQMIRGLSAARYTISFFKPSLAREIYFKLIGDAEYPIVFDPCMGFGGRLVGFKSMYPNGIYIGCEPNIDTYNELVELKKEFINLGYTADTIQLHNCKFEDFDISTIKYDVCFTSIPYYTAEKYSNNIKYGTFESWKTQFISKFYELHDCYLNIPENLKSDIIGDTAYTIINNTSHFNKSTNKKTELIIKLN
jgi:G:T-mismatch repair DNA endonuclease (very short patch repair protein)